MIIRGNAQKLYVQLYKILRRKIESGEWTIGTLIPTEKEIGKTYKVSVITVRGAMSLLASDGYISRIQGKGTRVRDWKKCGGKKQEANTGSIEGILHEINNPLAIIGEKAGWMRDLLKEENGSINNFDEYRKIITDIKHQVNRAKKTTHALTDLPQKIESIKKGGKK